MKLYFAGLALAIFSVSALADDGGLFYVAGGAGARGANFSVGAGSKVDALEISSINLGAASGTSSVKFTGLSLVQNATPINGFNFLFRLGIGKATTTFANGYRTTRSGLGNGIFFGLGGEYQFNRHLAVRGELYRITYAATVDGAVGSASYPVTLSALFIF